MSAALLFFFFSQRRKRTAIATCAERTTAPAPSFLDRQASASLPWEPTDLAVGPAPHHGSILDQAAALDACRVAMARPLWIAAVRHVGAQLTLAGSYIYPSAAIPFSFSPAAAALFFFPPVLLPPEATTSFPLLHSFSLWVPPQEYASNQS